MSYCINPQCPHPDDPANDHHAVCHHCGSSLFLLDKRYRVLRLLSDNSGFALIYETLDLNSSSLKILKTLKQRHNTNNKAVELFEQEAKVLSELDHPGIPKVDPNGYFKYFPRDSTEPVHCFIMEKIDGPTLKQWMHQQGNLLISEQQAINWLMQITEILHKVHQKKYFHRDIKLQNIMLRSNGQLVLIDFGTAREYNTYLAQMGSSMNMTKVSSAGYTPPEQEKGHAVPQSDFFALGRTFVYLLTGKHLDDADIYDPITDEFNWRKYAHDISVEFADFLDKLMANRAIDRPKNTEEILETLAHLQKVVEVHHPNSYIPRLPATELQTSPDSPTLPQETSQHHSETQSHPKGLLGLAIAGFLLLGSYGVWQITQTRLHLLLPEKIEKIAISGTFTGHTSNINDVTISSDSKFLFSASADRTIKMWDLQSGKLLKNLVGHTSYVNDILVSPDGQFLFSAGADKTIKIWDIATAIPLKTLRGHLSFVDLLIVSPDGQTLVSASADKTIKIWTLPDGKEQYTLKGHTSFINKMMMTQDGLTLVSGSADATIKVWNIKTGTERYTLKGHQSFINALAISPDGQTLVSGSADKTIKIWDLTTGTERETLRGHRSFVNDLIITPDGELLASASADKTIKIWDLKTGSIQRTLLGYQGYVNRLGISPDGQTLIGSSADRTIRFWDLSKGEETRLLTGGDRPIQQFTISPDGRFVAVGNGDRIIIWQIAV